MSTRQDGTLTCDGGEWGIGCDEVAADGGEWHRGGLFEPGWKVRDDGWARHPETGTVHCPLHRKHPFATRDHYVYVYGQSSADGWACRKPGCGWQAPLGHADKASAQALHDEYVATQQQCAAAGTGGQR